MCANTAGESPASICRVQGAWRRAQVLLYISTCLPKDAASPCRSMISSYCSLIKWPIINHLYLIIMSPQHKHTWSSCHHSTNIPDHVTTAQTYLIIMSPQYKYNWSCHHSTNIPDHHVTTAQTYLIITSPQHKHTWSCHHSTNIPDHHVTTAQTYLIIMPPQYKHTWSSCHHSTNTQRQWCCQCLTWSGLEPTSSLIPRIHCHLLLKMLLAASTNKDETQCQCCLLALKKKMKKNITLLSP